MKLRVEISLAPEELNLLRAIENHLRNLNVGSEQWAVTHYREGEPGWPTNTEIAEEMRKRGAPADISRLTVSTPEEIARLTLEDEARQATAGTREE